MCQFCDLLRTNKGPRPGLSKACLLAGKCGSDKPLCVLLHHLYDEEDTATKYTKDADHVTKNRDHQLVNNKHKMTIATTDLDLCIASRNYSKGPLYLSFQAHGAPGWTIGANGTVLSEVQAILQMGRLKCAIQLKMGRPVEAIVLRSCYSAVECFHNGRFLLSSARLVSLLNPGVLVVGYLGSDNGSTTVTGLCEDRKLPLAQGTVSFFNGLVEEGAERADLCVPVRSQATRDELQRLCFFAPLKLPLQLVPAINLPEMIALVNHNLYLAAVAERTRIGRAFAARRRQFQHARQLALQAPVQVVPLQQLPIQPQQQGGAVVEHESWESWEDK